MKYLNFTVRKLPSSAIVNSFQHQNMVEILPVSLISSAQKSVIFIKKQPAINSD